MNKDRDRQLNLVVGFPGCGKSTYVARMINNSVDRNALVFVEDVDIEADAWKDFPETRLLDYTGGRVKINAEEFDYPEFLEQVARNYRNGILVIDEGGLHEHDILSREMKRVVATRRKIGVDIFIMYHGMSDLPIRQFQYVNNIILFHTSDNFKYKSSRIPKMDELISAKERIALKVAAGNKYANEQVKLF